MIKSRILMYGSIRPTKISRGLRLTYKLMAVNLMQGYFMAILCSRSVFWDNQTDLKGTEEIRHPWKKRIKSTIYSSGSWLYKRKWQLRNAPCLATSFHYCWMTVSLLQRIFSIIAGAFPIDGEGGGHELLNQPGQRAAVHNTRTNELIVKVHERREEKPRSHLSDMCTQPPSYDMKKS